MDKDFSLAVVIPAALAGGAAGALLRLALPQDWLWENAFFTLDLERAGYIGAVIVGFAAGALMEFKLNDRLRQFGLTAFICALLLFTGFTPETISSIEQQGPAAALYGLLLSTVISLSLTALGICCFKFCRHLTRFAT